MLLEYSEQCFREEKPLEQKMHAKAMRLFREYMLVSGMPQSVVAYAENSRDFYASDVERTFTVTISKRPPSDTTPEYPRSLRISPAISRPTRKRSSSLRSTTARAMHSMMILCSGLRIP